MSRPLCGWPPPQAEGQLPDPGSQAAGLTGSSRSFYGCQEGFFHAPRAAPARSAAPRCPRRGDVPSRASAGDARAKSKQRGGEGGREGEKEQESQTESGSTNGISGCPTSGDNKQAWSPFARAGGRGKGQRVWKGAPGMSSQAEAVAAPFPVLSGNVPLAEVLPTHPHLEVSPLNAAPELQDSGRAVGLSPRALGSLRQKF